MIIAKWVSIVTVLICTTALAQQSGLYSGTWQVRMVNTNGEQREGTVILKGEEGTWDIEHQNFKHHPCIGMPAPIVIQHASANDLVFQIIRSKSLKGCKDNVATLKRVNETTLQGELDDGRKLTLIRE